MKIHFNPFSYLFETRTSPHAKTLREGFLQKLKESFYVIFGRGGQKKGIDNFTVGVVDCLTLGSLLALSIMGDWFEENREKNILTKVMYYPSQALAFFSFFLRVVLSCLILISAIPIITVVHAASSLIAQSIFSKALDVQGEYEYFDTSTRIDRGDFLRNVTEPYEYKKEIGTLQEALKKNNIRLQSPDENDCSCKITRAKEGVDIEFTRFSKTFFCTTLSSEPEETMAALIRLNLFGVTKAVEEFSSASINLTS